jgi:hypothetical protein
MLMDSWKSIIRKTNDLHLFPKNGWKRSTRQRGFPTVSLLYIVISSLSTPKTKPTPADYI